MTLLPERLICADSGITSSDHPQVSQLEQDLEKERTALSQALRRREREVEEVTQEVQKKDRQAAELSGSITWDHLPIHFLHLPDLGLSWAADSQRFSYSLNFLYAGLFTAVLIGFQWYFYLLYMQFFSNFFRCLH